MLDHPKNKGDLATIIYKRVKESKNPNLNDIDTSSVSDFSKLFNGLDIESVNISAWDMSNATTLNGMFSGCSNLKDVGDLSNWDISNVEDMGNLFFKCPKLKSVDLSKWRPEKLKNITGMFFNCTSLTSVGDLNNWDVSSLKEKRYVFTGTKIDNQDKPKWMLNW